MKTPQSRAVRLTPEAIRIVEGWTLLTRKPESAIASWFIIAAETNELGALLEHLRGLAVVEKVRQVNDKRLAEARKGVPKL